MEISDFHIIIKSKVEMDYDVPHNVPLYLITLNFNQLHLISLIIYVYL